MSDGSLMRNSPSSSDAQIYGSDDFFRARLDQITWLDHALFRLTDSVLWAIIVVQVTGLLPVTPEAAGHRSLSVRMIVELLYVKRAYYLPDGRVLGRGLESPYMQRFTSQMYVEHKLSCDPPSQTRLRKQPYEGSASTRLAPDREPRYRLGTAGRDLLEAEYTWDQRARRVLEGIVPVDHV